MARTKKKAALTPEERLQAALVPDWEWPYKLPENWCWTTVGAINQYEGISADPTKAKNETFELYSVPSSADNYPEIVLGADIGSAKQSVKKGDVLLCKINPRINRVWKVSKYTDHSLLASSEWIVIRNSRLISNYLMWCFRSPYFRGYMLSNVSGVGGSLMRAQPKFVQGYPIPVPPLAEQQRIVYRIENLFAKLDEAKEKAQAVVDSFETRKAAILHKAFAGELTKKWRKSANTRWVYKKIKDCCKLGSGGTPSRKVPDFYKGDIPWIKTGEIEWNDIYDTEEKITQSAIDNSSARCYKPGVVLVAMYGMGVTRGKASILRVQAATNQAVCVLEPQSALLYNRYLLYYFMRNYWDIREKAVGGNQLNLSLTIIKELNIEIPPIDEQMEIVQILDDLFAKEQKAKESAEAVLDQIDLMKKSILARAFRGELGTNDPSEESAVELLKKVSHMPAETKSKAKRKFAPPKIEAQIKTDLERKIIMAFIQSDTVIMPIQQLMSVSSRKFDVIETLRNLQERGILLKENDTYKLMG